MTQELQRVAVIGTGIMGGHIARRLAAAGREVIAWNRDISKLRALSAHGVAEAESPIVALTGCDAVIVMLSTGPVVDEVLFGARGGERAPVDVLRPGAVVVVMSSIPVDTSRAQARLLAGRGIDYVDAPVSGGEAGARDGRLAIMAGGRADVIARICPLLAPLGRVTRVGQVGSGQLAKLANQIIVGAGVAAIAEALHFARVGGADPAAVRDALAGGFADSTLLRQHGERMVHGQFAPGGSADHQLKDLRTAESTAAALGLDLVLLTAARSLFEDMVRNGDGGLDHSGVIREVARRMSQATTCATRDA